MTISYDPAGRVTEIADDNSDYTYTYDDAGRVTSVDNSGTPGAPSVTLTYGYDAAGNRTSLTDNLGGVVSYTYDERNRLTQETQSGTGVASERADFAYDAAGNRTSLTRYSDLAGTSVVAVTGYTFDDANRLTNIATLNSSSGTISSYAYTLDPASRLTQEVRTWNGGSSSDTITYGYTDNGQLTSVSHTNGSFSNESYSYDDNGNRTMSGYSTGTGNELSSDGTYNYTYDAAGNMTSKTDIATGVETDYVWDDRNRLVEVDQVVSGVNTVLALYTYDALNNPIKVVEGGTTRWTVYDGNRPVLDFDGSGTLTARYLQGPMVDEVLARDTPSGGVAWYLPDRLGTVRDIIDNSGTVLDHIAYDAYGQILSQSNASAGDRFEYAGMQTDATTGLYFDQARWYDPQSGRFITVDPKSFSAKDTNLYRYVENSPSIYVDPSGEDLAGGFGGLISGGLVGFVVGGGFNPGGVAGAILGGLGGFIYGLLECDAGFWQGGRWGVLWGVVGGIGGRIIGFIIESGGGGGGTPPDLKALKYLEILAKNPYKGPRPPLFILPILPFMGGSNLVGGMVGVGPGGPGNGWAFPGNGDKPPWWPNRQWDPQKQKWAPPGWWPVNGRCGGINPW
ncbi:MAG TPA: RHS repeat-associated core domain-containing protein [Isosphaeraceae bacterium]|nr:RHS repeat-associated core domain-containing protein [Isosphaeraceae bacterium]